jgi:hypothetical protein
LILFFTNYIESFTFLVTKIYGFYCVRVLEMIAVEDFMVEASYSNGYEDRYDELMLRCLEINGYRKKASIKHFKSLFPGFRLCNGMLILSTSGL